MYPSEGEGENVLGGRVGGKIIMPDKKAGGNGGEMGVRGSRERVRRTYESSAGPALSPSSSSRLQRSPSKAHAPRSWPSSSAMNTRKQNTRKQTRTRPTLPSSSPCHRVSTIPTQIRSRPVCWSRPRTRCVRRRRAGRGLLLPWQSTTRSRTASGAGMGGCHRTGRGCAEGESTTTTPANGSASGPERVSAGDG